MARQSPALLRRLAPAVQSIECAQGKCYVGCHLDAPTVRTQPAQIENQMIRAGTTIPPIAQAIGSAACWAEDNSPASILVDFEPDQEKKHGHQTVIDPLVQAQRKLVLSDPRVSGISQRWL